MHCNALLTGCMANGYQAGCLHKIETHTWAHAHLLLQYLKNEDSSSVSFRKFNGDKRDIYPSFSICMHSVKGATLKKYPEIHGLNGSDGIEIYRNMLKGRQNLSMEFKTFNFENNSIDILSEFVDMFVSYSKQGQQLSVWNRKQHHTESPFYKSYQDPYFSNYNLYKILAVL